MFDEKKLRAEIAANWGEYGAHVEVFDMLMRRVTELEALVGTVREIAGCPNRNVRDISAEQHSQEIAEAIRNR